METTIKTPSSNKKFSELVPDIIHSFIANYKTYSLGNGFNTMPRRIQLSSLIMQNILQNPYLINTFLDDDDIKSFFNAKDVGLPPIENQTCVIDNSGSGGTVQIITVISNIILSAIDLAMLENGKLDEHIIMANIPKALEKFKTFIKGDPINEEHLIGFSGFMSDQKLSIGFGDKNAFSLTKEQSLYFFGNENVSLLVKETFCRKKLFSGSQKQMQNFIANNLVSLDINFLEKMHSLTRNIQLALALSLSENDIPFYSYLEGDYLISPTGNLNSFIWKNERIIRKNTTTKLKKEHTNKISIKYLTLVDKDTSSMNIAMNRLLSAICLRDNPDDALIDAIMCWENIIGSEYEVSFQICASISKLLSKNSAEKDENYTALKNIYKARSSLVHGNTNYTTNEETTNSAIMYAIKLINAILADEKLLGTKSEDRSKYILLGE